MAKNSTLEKDIKLIQEVRKHENLYDRNNAQFKQKLGRNEAWISISYNLETDLDLCKTRWRSIRDRFVKSYSKKLADGIRDDENPLNPNEWILFPYLDFLVDYVTTRITLADFESRPVLAINDQQLIAEVSKHPAVYTKNTLDSRNKIKRARAWESISSNLNVEEATCQRRWRSIRDRFVKICSKRNLAGANISGDTDDVDWYLLPHLEFLSKHISTKKSKQDINAPQVVNYASLEQNLDDDYSYADNNCDYPCPTTTPPDSKRRRSEVEVKEEFFTISDYPSPSTTEHVTEKSETDVHEKMCNLIDRIQELTEEKLKNRQELYTNKNSNFLKIVDEKLEQIPPEEKEDAKMFILNYLHKLTKPH